MELINYSPEIIKTLRYWYLTKKLVEDNNELNGDLCAKRMFFSEKADNELYALTPSDELPPIVNLFIERNKDRGCSKCRYSSSIKNNHEDCQRKIAEWFGYRAALMAWIKSVFIRFNTISELEKVSEEFKDLLTKNLW